MGVHILGQAEQAVMYCSTSDWAFGPVFSADGFHDAADRAEAFLRWLVVDARTLSDNALDDRYRAWRAQEAAQWQREGLEANYGLEGGLATSARLVR
jgi:hypothetical protein